MPTADPEEFPVRHFLRGCRRGRGKEGNHYGRTSKDYEHGAGGKGKPETPPGKRYDRGEYRGVHSHRDLRLPLRGAVLSHHYRVVHEQSGDHPEWISADTEGGRAEPAIVSAVFEKSGRDSPVVRRHDFCDGDGNVLRRHDGLHDRLRAQPQRFPLEKQVRVFLLFHVSRGICSASAI